MDIHESKSIYFGDSTNCVLQSQCPITVVHVYSDDREYGEQSDVGDVLDYSEKFPQILSTC